MKIVEDKKLHVNPSVKYGGWYRILARKDTNEQYTMPIMAFVAQGIKPVVNYFFDNDKSVTWSDVAHLDTTYIFEEFKGTIQVP